MDDERVLKSKWFQRFALREAIGDDALRDAAERARRGQIDADLGGGVIKQRVARRGEGKSGGYRTILLFRKGQLAVYFYGFAKNDRGNIRQSELRVFKEAAKHVLSLTRGMVDDLVRRGEFMEVRRR